jgi:hypothetical protein
MDRECITGRTNREGLKQAQGRNKDRIRGGIDSVKRMRRRIRPRVEPSRTQARWMLRASVILTMEGDVTGS